MSSNKNGGDNKGNIKTLGEIFPDDSVIELVASEAENRLNLLFWNGHRKTIAPEIHCRGRVYQAPELHESIKRAIRFPKNAINYGAAQEMITETLNLFERYIGLARPEAALMTAWTSSTWFSDCLSSPPLLLISGVDMSHAITLFRLLHCLCRRPLMLGDVNQPALHSLTRLQSTLLVNQPNLSPRMRDLWGTANYRGVYVFGTGNRLFDVVGSKAIFLGTTSESSDQAVHLALAPADPKLPPLDGHRQAEIANRLQPQFLTYRLRNFRKVREFLSTGHQPEFPNGEIAYNLRACLQGEHDIAQAIGPLLQRQEQDAAAQRTWDPNAAMVEVIGALLHQKSKGASPTEIAKLTNALLRCRGEFFEYGAVEIGWRLRQLGLYRSGRQQYGSALLSRHQPPGPSARETLWSKSAGRRGLPRLRPSASDCLVITSVGFVGVVGILIIFTKHLAWRSHANPKIPPESSGAKRVSSRSPAAANLKANSRYSGLVEKRSRPRHHGRQGAGKLGF